MKVTCAVGSRSPWWLLCIGAALTISSHDSALAFQVGYRVSQPTPRIFLDTWVGEPRRPIVDGVRILKGSNDSGDGSDGNEIVTEESRSILQRIKHVFRNLRLGRRSRNILSYLNPFGRRHKTTSKRLLDDDLDDTAPTSALNDSVVTFGSGLDVSTTLDIVHAAIGSTTNSTITTTTTASSSRPTVVSNNVRWATAAPNVDLSGKWTIVVSDDFLKQYDTYLSGLGQPFLVRSVAMSIIGRTTEETAQTDHGRTLLIRSINARGEWERTLMSSGAVAAEHDKHGKDEPYQAVHTPILTVDKETVQAEAWWEDDGTVHRSWLRGVTKYGGGDFESRRYLEDNGTILVCESTFHPRIKSRQAAQITWRFRRLDEPI